MKTAYLVPWVDVEYGWGKKPDGYKIFFNKENCINDTIEKSKNGCGVGFYWGPERPIYYYEVPYDSLLDIYKKEGFFTNPNWHPKFKSKEIYINEK